MDTGGRRGFSAYWSWGLRLAVVLRGLRLAFAEPVEAMAGVRVRVWVRGSVHGFIDWVRFCARPLLLPITMIFPLLLLFVVRSMLLLLWVRVLIGVDATVTVEPRHYPGHHHTAITTNETFNGIIINPRTCHRAPIFPGLHP